MIVSPLLATIDIHAALAQTLDKALNIIRPDFHMGLDFSLALIPLLIALLIFRHYNGISPLLWWPSLVIFLLFLPNAPYVITDVIHFVAKVRVTPPLPIWAMSLLLLEYFIYFFIGMECFVLSLMLWGRALKRHGHGWLILPLEIAVISLSAFGIYLGRVDRLNTWDVATDPEHLLNQALRDALNPKPQEMTLLFFIAITLIYFLLKGANCFIAILLSPHSRGSTIMHKGE
jgi:uncharacterized membrane protein